MGENECLTWVFYFQNMLGYFFVREDEIGGKRKRNLDRKGVKIAHTHLRFPHSKKIENPARNDLTYLKEFKTGIQIF